MKNLKFISFLVIWGAITTFMSCSNDGENLGMYSDEEFHDKIVQIQNKYNSSLKIDEASLHKDDETLTNIDDIMRTIENSSFCYELITSEEGGLVAMPILSTTVTRSNSLEVNSYVEILSHELLPCRLEISYGRDGFQIKSRDDFYHLVNISCGGSVSTGNINISGDIKIRPYGTTTYKAFRICRRKNSYEDIFEVTEINL